MSIGKKWILGLVLVGSIIGGALGGSRPAHLSATPPREHQRQRFQARRSDDKPAPEGNRNCVRSVSGVDLREQVLHV